MSRIKAEAKQAKRGALNTTINESVLTEFKRFSKELGLPMNVLIESFMQGMIENSLVLKIGKNNRIEIDEKDSKE